MRVTPQEQTVIQAAIAAARALTGGELFLSDAPAIELIRACLALNPDDKQLAVAAEQGYTE